MEHLRKVAFLLVVFSLLGVNFSKYFGGAALDKFSVVLFAAGVVLLLVSPFVPAGGRRQERGHAERKERELFKGLPASLTGDDQALSESVPAWVYILAGALILPGFAAFSIGPNGVNAWTVTTFSMVVGGFLLIIGAKLSCGGSAVRRNMAYGALALVSFLALLAGFFLAIFIIVEAFDQGRGAKYWPLVGVLVAGGAAGVYYGMRYQQSSEGRAIGRRLGFSDADGGADGIYDSKGLVNGLEVLIDVDQRPPHKGHPARYRLEALCRCRNTSGARLSVKPRGFLGLSVGLLPRLEGVLGWEDFVVRCDQQDAAARLLSGARKAGSVFDEETGFREMFLRGGEFVFVYSDEGYLTAELVKRVVEEASLLASKLY